MIVILLAEWVFGDRVRVANAVKGNYITVGNLYVAGAGIVGRDRGGNGGRIRTRGWGEDVEHESKSGALALG